jgi:hypothetical protein
MQPKVISDDAKEQRYANVVKLTGLPNNTTVWNLKNLVEEYNIKYIHIPRNGKFNTPLKFCFIYFADKNSLAIATNKVFSLNGNQLSWVPADTKTCHRCGDLNHFVADCDYEDKRPRYKNQTEVLRQFNKERQNRRKGNNNKLTYADKLKQERNNNFQRSNNNHNYRPWNKFNMSRDHISNWNKEPNHQKQTSTTAGQLDLNNIGHVLKLAMKNLDRLNNKFTVFQNEQKSIQDELTSFKRKQAITDTHKPNTIVNKNLTNQSTGVVTNTGSKRVRMNSSNDSSHELSDLETRQAESIKKSNAMAKELSNLQNTMGAILQQLN